MKLREFLYFNKSDRRVLLFLLAMACLVVAFIQLGDRGSKQTQLTPADSAAMEQSRYRPYSHNDRHYRQRHYQYATPGQTPERFPFDPNTADSTQLLRLGLKEWQVRNIYKYRASGGIYRRPEDFARLYGLTRKEYRELRPYIHISDDYLAASTIYNFEPATQRDTVRAPIKMKPQERLALNSADTTALKHVPGIGSFFARKIVNYRQRLGGFHSINQLMEIEDFPQSSLSYFILPDDKVQRLNLNQLSLEALRRHPYINFHQAKAIVDYRRLHGPLKSLQDLRLHRDFTPEAISRLEPYVEF